MKKCVIYTRVSTFKQSQSRQLQDLRQEAQIHGYEVIMEFSETVSGRIKTSERSAFIELEKFVNDNSDITRIYLSELSRLGRDMIDVLVKIDSFTNRNIGVYLNNMKSCTIKEDGSKNHELISALALLSSYAQSELERTTERVKSGLLSKKREGGANGAIQPFGYKSVNKKIEIDDEEAENVKNIFNLYLNGYGTQRIANYLNSHDVKTRFYKKYSSKDIRTKSGYVKKGIQYKWVDGTIYTILTNRIYIGERKHKGEVFLFDKLKIIDDVDFFKVQELLKINNNKKNNTTKYTNFLKGIIKCGQCGASYYMHRRKDKSDNAYKCLSKRTKYTTCDNPSINIDKLNNALFDYLVTRGWEMTQKEINEKMSFLSLEIEKCKIDIDSCEKNIVNYSKSIENNYELMVSDLTFKQIGKNTHTNLTQQLELENQKLLKLKKELLQYSNILDKLKTNEKIKLNPQNFKTFLPEIIEKITVFKEENNEIINRYKNDDIVIRVEILFKPMYGTTKNLFLSQKSKNIYVDGGNRKSWILPCAHIYQIFID